MHWLTSRKSKLSIENKLKIYKNEPYKQNRDNTS